MAKRNIYKVVIQSGVNDDSKYQERTFYIDEQDDELLWHLLRRIGVEREVWEAQQQQRRAEEARRQRAQYEREQQYREDQRARERQADEEFRRRQQSRSGSTGGPSYTFNAGFFDQASFNFEEFANSFRGYDDGRRTTPPRTEHKTTGNHTHRKVELAAMAGIDWEEAKGMDPKKLLKRAQRKCHPDTGGSHEAWLNLQKLQSAMGL